MDGDKYVVKLYVYDISNGMARTMSPMFLGKLIEGIWHTGLVVYGKEYFYGGGICSGIPGSTPYGTHVKEIHLGETEIPMDLFESYLEEINERYNIDTYHILNNNCNHFTNEIVNFLVGNPLPDWILKQHDEIANTSLGKMILPMLEQMSTQNNQFMPQMFEKK